MRLYHEAIRMSSEGFSAAAVGRELGVSNDTVRTWVRNGPPKRVRRYEPDLTPSADLAYVAGFYIGDGKGAGTEHKIRFELADEEQLEIVSRKVARILGREPKPFTRDGSFHVVGYDSVVLSDYLNQSFSQLVGQLHEYAKDFIQGFADAEGYVSPRLRLERQELSSVVVGIVNTRIEYLRAIKELLSSLGIGGTICRTSRKGGLMTIRGKTFIRKHDVYHLLIQGYDNVRRF